MNGLFMRAEEVAKELGVSKAYAYKLIRHLNNDLEKRGFLTISGRVSRQYFKEQLYNSSEGNQKGEKDVSV